MSSNTLGSPAAPREGQPFRLTSKEGGGFTVTAGDRDLSDYITAVNFHIDGSTLRPFISLTVDADHAQIAIELDDVQVHTQAEGGQS